MSRLDPALSLAGHPGPGVLDGAALLDHLDGRLGGARAPVPVRLDR